LTWQKK